jgi:curved DNA-binding protein CbpA
MFKHSFKTKLFSTPILKTFNNNFFKTFSEKIIMKKDYYKILGVAKTATEEEIKVAYRNLAKRYHPDVNIGAEKHEPNIEKFRDIAEAYAVLSNKTMRLDYDMRMKNNSDIIYNAEKMKNMEETKMNRDSKGNQIKPGPMKGSYAEYRLEKLKEIRKSFNVNDHGMHKGGIPRQGGGQSRGTAYGPPGTFHNEWSHNEIIHDLPHIRPHVTRFEAETHKKFMNCKNILNKFSYSVQGEL